MRIKKPLSLTIYFLLATIPLLFGARHPLIHGGYSFIILVVCGGWLIFHADEERSLLLRRSALPPLLLILFIFLTSVSLPLFLLRLVSPVRADYLAEASLLADLPGFVTSLSYYAPDTRFLAVYLLGLLCYFFCAASWFAEARTTTAALWIITAVGLFEAAYGLLQAMNPSLGTLWLPAGVGAEGCARGTIIYRNQYAALLNMAWPMALVLGISLYRPAMDTFAARRTNKENVSLTDRTTLIFQKGAFPFWSAGFMILAVIFSRSRGGICTMFLLAALLVILLPFPRRFKGIAGSVFFLFILLYGGMIGFRDVIERFFFFYEGAAGRFALWLDSLTMLRDHPLAGIGMGAYQFVSPVYLRAVPDQLWFDFAHNEYVEMAVELGLPGLLLLLGWIGWGMIRYGGTVTRPLRSGGSLLRTPDSAFLAVAAYCALLGFLFHGLVDFVWRLPANAFYAVTLLAMLHGAVTRRTTREPG